MSEDLLGKVAALSCALIWAFAVIFFKRSGETVQPVSLNLFKTIVSSMMFAVTMVLTGTSFFPQGADSINCLMLIISGVIGICISDNLFLKSLNLLGAGLSAIVDCLYSPFIVIFSWVIFSDTPVLSVIGGGILIISAILIATLKSGKDQINSKNIIYGIILGAIAMLLQSFSVILMKPAIMHFPILWVIEIRLLAALAALIIQVLFMKNRNELLLSFIRAKTWQFALPASVLGSYFSMMLWIWAFRLTDLSSAVILNQTNAIFIVVLAGIFLKEPLTVRRVFASITAVIGSVLVLAS
jgi:drug/metabolite transporter (DMT)-like permease